MKINDLKTLTDGLDLFMDKRISQPENDRHVCYDGAINIEKYYNSKIKIAWLLKEPYDGKDGKGGGHRLSTFINDQKTMRTL